MKILKFPKLKKNINIQIKVKCEKCGTVLLIDDVIEDVILDNSLCFDDNTPCFSVECPYCLKIQSLSYSKCKKIKKWMDVTCTPPDSMRTIFDSFITEIKSKKKLIFRDQWK